MTHTTTCDVLVRNGACTCAPVRTALQVKAMGNLYIWCSTCQRTAHTWPYGAAVTIAQIILAEQRHLADVHPKPAPDYDALHDGLYEDGLG